MERRKYCVDLEALGPTKETNTAASEVPISWTFWMSYISLPPRNHQPARPPHNGVLQKLYKQPRPLPPLHHHINRQAPPAFPSHQVPEDFQRSHHSAVCEYNNPKLTIVDLQVEFNVTGVVVELVGPDNGDLGIVNFLLRL